MWTIRYRGFYINGYCDRDECSISIYPGIKFKSLRAAKNAAGRMANELRFIESGKNRR